MFRVALWAAPLLDNPRGPLEIAVQPKVAQIKSVNILLWQHWLDIGQQGGWGGKGGGLVLPKMGFDFFLCGCTTISSGPSGLQSKSAVRRATFNTIVLVR